MSKEIKISNVNDLRDELAEVFSALRSGEITPKDAAEFANIAGKMINSTKAQLEYCEARQEQPNIKFLESTDKC